LLQGLPGLNAANLSIFLQSSKFSSQNLSLHHIFSSSFHLLMLATLKLEPRTITPEPLTLNPEQTIIPVSHISDS